MANRTLASSLSRYTTDLTALSPEAFMPGAVGSIGGAAIGTIIGQIGTEIINQIPKLIGAGGTAIATKITSPSVTQIPTYAMTVHAGHKRMNCLNPKALRRSMRRVEGFARFAKKTIAFTKRVHMKKKKCRR